jgi:hypothetical protein
MPKPKAKPIAAAKYRALLARDIISSATMAAAAATDALRSHQSVFDLY